MYIKKDVFRSNIVRVIYVRKVFMVEVVYERNWSLNRIKKERDKYY